MSYDLFNENGYAGPGPSINGLRCLKAAVTGLSSAAYPQLASLFTYGYAPSPMRFKRECVELSQQVDDPDVKSTLLEMGKAAAKSQEIVILHNHLSS